MGARFAAAKWPARHKGGGARPPPLNNRRILTAPLPCARPAIAAAATALLPDVLLLPTILLHLPISLTVLAHSGPAFAAILADVPVALAILAHCTVTAAAILAHVAVALALRAALHRRAAGDPACTCCRSRWRSCAHAVATLPAILPHIPVALAIGTHVVSRCAIVAQLVSRRSFARVRSAPNQ